MSTRAGETVVTDATDDYGHRHPALRSKNLIEFLMEFQRVGKSMDKSMEQQGVAVGASSAAPGAAPAVYPRNQDSFFSESPCRRVGGRARGGRTHRRQRA